MTQRAACSSLQVGNVLSCRGSNVLSEMIEFPDGVRSIGRLLACSTCAFSESVEELGVIIGVGNGCCKGRCVCRGGEGRVD